MKKIAVMIFSVVMATSVMAQSASDVPKSDPAYNAINRTVKDGYLSLYSGDAFQAQQAITRRELAIVIDKLLTDADQSQLSLSRAEIQDLKALSKAYREYFVLYESSLSASSVRLTAVENDEKSLNRDLSQLNEDMRNEIKVLKKERDSQAMTFWTGIVVAGLLGILVK